MGRYQMTRTCSVGAAACRLAGAAVLVVLLLLVLPPPCVLLQMWLLAAHRQQLLPAISAWLLLTCRLMDGRLALPAFCCCCC